MSSIHRNRARTMTCYNPDCRHRDKRKLRPLVISLIKEENDIEATTVPIIGGGNSRHELITRMFATDPSLASHFEPPVFSPGVPSRDLRNRMKLLEHCNSAGLIPDVEWEAIMKAVNEHNMSNHREDTIGSSLQDSIVPTNNYRENEKVHKVLNPFKYLAIETLIPPIDDAKFTNKKAKHWLEYETTSLIPISPERQGSTEDRALPYSMEIWRKAKTLNRDRSVLACSLAHLLAMKTLVGEDNGNETSVDSNDGVGFDFILEDNVRAFTGMNMTEKHSDEAAAATTNDWSCECANRIWDTIEASNEASHDCHMRYYGWLASLPNMRWIYHNHMPRSAFNGAKHSYDGSSKCIVFPRPTTEDFELDSNTKTKEEDLHDEKGSSNCNGPHFTTPGGTAVWGTFAYTVSPTAHRTIINRLKNDVGLLMWKGKRMRAYKAKPIDKIIPRLISEEFGPTSVHVLSKPAFVRCPMLGSLLHPQWEAGFCNSTELQYQLSCGGNESVHSSTSINGYDVWNNVWLAKEERQIVRHRVKSGHWVHEGCVPDDLCDICVRESTSSRSPSKSAKSLSAIFLAAIIVIASTPSMSAFNASINHRFKRPKFVMNSSHDPDDCADVYERRRGKIGRMSIISRTVYLDTDDLMMRSKEEEFVGHEINSLNVTVWEMDKPSKLIQEWWSIDESERCSRVGDPFGVVMWPGSILASKELLKLHYSNNIQRKSPIVGATVLVLGAGTGVEAQTAALLGAKRVIATDINPLTLKLLEYGAKDAGIPGILEGKYFDLLSDITLPKCDILIVADVLYNQDLAKQVGRRIHEAIVRSFDEGAPPTKIIVTDSQQFHGTNFLEDAKLRELNAILQEGNFEQLRWESHKIERVCTSGVLIGKSYFFLLSRLVLLCSLLVPYLTDEDQTYDADVRMITWGW